MSGKGKVMYPPPLSIPFVGLMSQGDFAVLLLCLFLLAGAVVILALMVMIEIIE